MTNRGGQHPSTEGIEIGAAPSPPKEGTITIVSLKKIYFTQKKGQGSTISIQIKVIPLILNNYICFDTHRQPNKPTGQK